MDGTDKMNMNYIRFKLSQFYAAKLNRKLSNSVDWIAARRYRVYGGVSESDFTIYTRFEVVNILTSLPKFQYSYWLRLQYTGCFSMDWESFGW